MPRVKRGVTARARHKRSALAKVPRSPQNVFASPNEAVMKAGPVRLPRPPQQEARVPPPWIARINAASRGLGLTYSSS